MSRYRDWTNAESGMVNWIINRGYGINKGKYSAYIEIRKIVGKYCAEKKIEGTYSERILSIHFRTFGSWFLSKDWPQYKFKPNLKTSNTTENE